MKVEFPLLIEDQLTTQMKGIEPVEYLREHREDFFLAGPVTKRVAILNFDSETINQENLKLKLLDAKIMVNVNVLCRKAGIYRVDVDRGRTASCPTAPAQIPACSFPAPGSS